MNNREGPPPTGRIRCRLKYHDCLQPDDGYDGYTFVPNCQSRAFQAEAHKHGTMIEGHGRVGLQETQCKHQSSGKLLSPLEIHPDQLDNWHAQDDNVEHDVDSRVDPRLQVDAVAFSFSMFSVPPRPCIADGPALENSGNAEGQAGRETDAD